MVKDGILVYVPINRMVISFLEIFSLMSPSHLLFNFFIKTYIHLVESTITRSLSFRINENNDHSFTKRLTPLATLVIHYYHHINYHYNTFYHAMLELDSLINTIHSLTNHKQHKQVKYFLISYELIRHVSLIDVINMNC